jgi:hypothetical protein
MHRGIRALLERLDRDRPPGWLNVSVAALDVPQRLHPRLGALASKALFSPPETTLGLTYPTLTGERHAYGFINERQGERVGDEETLTDLLVQARREQVSVLTAVVVPEIRGRPLRVLAAATRV